ncbi:hypothetical protein B0H16DRAFT_608294 [Mycena metata]|uniref:Uncharacterized protein n=1 Tax=Mycena metata TaxID=1033252 RepID=A0AAD7K9G0_9AGAR|nr:hypothetical protein B0H16DRAFT_608294 [Mycena metata]
MNFISFTTLAVLIPGIYGLTVNTPSESSLVVCEPIALTWTDGTAPYYVSIIPGGDTSASALETFASTSDTSLTWTVDIAAGTSIAVQLKDSTGTIAYSDAVTIQSGSDTSCVGTDSSSATDSTASTVAVDTSGSAAATSAVATTSGVAKSTTKTGATQSTTTAAASTVASSATTSSGASSTLVFNYGLSGFLGLLGIALL